MTIMVVFQGVLLLQTFLNLKPVKRVNSHIMCDGRVCSQGLFILTPTIIVELGTLEFEPTEFFEAK